ncbi:MAG: hypothetical protein VB064_00330 [Oscillospiraceae bacterium]|nr:hypothetical protein [Oscillospiraceae bacterium]
MTALIILLYICVVLFDFIPYRKSRSPKETVIYCVLLSVSLCVLFLYSLGINVPGPSEPIIMAVEALFSPSK